MNTDEVRPVFDGEDSATTSEAVRALRTEAALRQRVVDDHMFTVTGPWAEQPSQGRYQGPIGPRWPGSGDLTAHHLQPVAQNQDLGVLGDIRAQEQSEDAEEPD